MTGETTPDLTLGEAQQLLAEYDADGWEHPPGFETDRHNLLHVCITTGKIAAALEAVDDGRAEPQPLPRKLVVDMLVYALRYANNEPGFDLTPALLERLQELRERNAARKAAAS